MEIEYSFSQIASASLSVEDYGNCAIEANNDEGLFWYIVVDTRYGWTRIFTYGPINPISPQLEEKCDCSFSRMEFNSQRIIKAIDKFLNTERKKVMPITQAREVSRDNALAQCKSIVEYMKNGENF